MCSGRGLGRALVIVLLISFTMAATAGQIERDVLDASINLGWAVGMLESEGMTANNIEPIRHGMHLAATHVHRVWVAFYEAGIGVDFSGIYDDLLHWEGKTGSMAATQRAEWISRIFGQLRDAASATPDPHTATTTGAPSCATYFADVGFSFGRANIAALVALATRSGALRVSAEWMLARARGAIDSGLSVAAESGCCFGSRDAWLALPVFQYVLPSDLSAVNEAFGTTREGMQALAGCQASPTLTAEPRVARPGQPITVWFSHAPGNDSDWISIFREDAPSERYGEWYYLQGIREGTLTFQAPAEPGLYEFRMFCCWTRGGFTPIARSHLIQVVNP